MRWPGRRGQARDCGAGEDWEFMWPLGGRGGGTPRTLPQRGPEPVKRGIGTVNRAARAAQDRTMTHTTPPAIAIPCGPRPTVDDGLRTLSSRRVRCCAPAAVVSTVAHETPTRDEGQQRRAAARWLLLRLRLRARPGQWRRRPTVQEDLHVDARHVPALVPVWVFAMATPPTRLCAEGTSRRARPCARGAARDRGSNRGGRSHAERPTGLVATRWLSA
jgi:hypothetical protein